MPIPKKLFLFRSLLVQENSAMGLFKSISPPGPWELASLKPISGTQKEGYRPDLATKCGHADLKYQDSQVPYCEAGSNSLFKGPDGELWSSCPYLIYQKVLVLTLKRLDRGH